MASFSRSSLHSVLVDEARNDLQQVVRALDVQAVARPGARHQFVAGPWDGVGDGFRLPPVVALLWVVVALVVVIATSPSTGPLLIVAGLVLAGGVYFAYLLSFRRHLLEHEIEVPAETSEAVG